VQINRTRDSASNVITTELFYRLCSPTPKILGGPPINCQEGNGRIPQSAMTGNVRTDPRRPDVVTVLVDTSQIEGSSGCDYPGQTPCFSNWICFDEDDFGTCNGGQTPNIGGLISMFWKKTKATETIATVGSKIYTCGKLTSFHSSSITEFTANQPGSAFGTTAYSTNAFVSTSTEANGLRERFAAARWRMKVNSHGN
jgi:hypothetical protein